MVRVLLFLLIFNFILPFSLLAYKIEGNLPENLKNIILKYHNELGESGISELLNSNNINLYHFKDNTLYIKDGMVVKSVKFKGNYYFLKRQLMAAAGIYENELYSLEKLEMARKSLTDFYISKGFYAAKVTYTVLAGDLVFEINSKDRFIITDIKLKGIDDSFDFKLKRNMVLNDKNISKLKSELQFKLRLKGYYNNKITYKIVKNNTHPYYFDIENTFQSFLSFIGLRHQGVSLIFNIKKGEKYSVVVTNDIDTYLDTLIRKAINKYLKKINIFSFRNLEYRIEKMIREGFKITANVKVSLSKNIILVDVNAKEKIEIYEVIVKYKHLKDNKFVNVKEVVKGKEDIFLNNLKKVLKANGFFNIKILSKKYIEKETVISEIKNQIEEKIDLELKITNFRKSNLLKNKKKILVFKIDEGNKYKVANNIINNKKYRIKTNIFADEEGIDAAKNQLYNLLSKEYYFTYLLIDNIKANSDGTVDIYYKDTLRKIEVVDFTVNNNKIMEIIKRRFFYKDNSLTVSKEKAIKKFLNSQKAILSYRIKILNIDKHNVIISIYLVYREPNSIYGGISYDSIDKLSFYLGYTRYNIFNSAHDLNLLITSSFREQFAGASITSSNFYFTNLTHKLEISTKTRDEDDYIYDINKLKLILSYDYKNFILSTNLYYEDIYIYDETYDDITLAKFNSKFKNIGNSFMLIYNNYDNLIDPKKGFGLKFITNPVYSTDDEDFFVVNTLVSSFYYTFFNTWTTSLRNEFGQINGSDETIPLIYRYTLGGPYRMRAYDYREVGEYDSYGKIYGGKTLFYLELNENYRINEYLSVGAFYEAGQAFDTFNSNDLKQDIGGYFGVNTPVGVLKLSYAVDTKDTSTRAFYIIFGTSIP